MKNKDKLLDKVLFGPCTYYFGQRYFMVKKMGKRVAVQLKGAREREMWENQYCGRNRCANWACIG